MDFTKQKQNAPGANGTEVIDLPVQKEIVTMTPPPSGVIHKPYFPLDEYHYTKLKTYCMMKRIPLGTFLNKLVLDFLDSKQLPGEE